MGMKFDEIQQNRKSGIKIDQAKFFTKESLIKGEN
jgi:hypothetical protein